MAESANVTSVEAIRSFRAALIQFGGEADEALVMLVLEVRKAVQWLQHDRALYWPDQLRKAQERVVQTRNDLDRCQLHYGSEDAPSCYDQKKALENAKRRLRFCEDKVQAVKRWTQVMRQELDEYQGEMAKMTNWLENDLPRATAALDRMLRALDKYTAESRGLEPQGMSRPREEARGGSANANRPAPRSEPASGQE